MSRLRLTALLLAALAVPRAAAAQNPRLHGPWLGAGLGVGSAKVNCDLCVNDRNGGLSGFLGGGVALGPSVRAGLELSGWRDETDGVRQTLMLYGGSLYWTLVPGSAWYLKGGLGLLHYHADTVDDPEDDPLDASTAALQLGAGYELRTGGRVRVTPFANLIVSTSGNLTSGNSVVTDASFSNLQLGVGVTWR
jgi:hypothetical protein